MTKTQAIYIVEKYLKQENDAYLASKHVKYENIYRCKSRLDKVKLAIDTAINSFFNLFTGRGTWIRFSIFNVQPKSYRVIELPMTEQEIQDNLRVVYEEECKEYKDFFVIVSVRKQYLRTGEVEIGGNGIFFLTKKGAKLFKSGSGIRYLSSLEDFPKFLSGETYSRDWEKAQLDYPKG